jgi:hypothetical protein
MYVELRKFAMGSRNNDTNIFFLPMHGGWLKKIMKSTAV